MKCLNLITGILSLLPIVLAGDLKFVNIIYRHGDRTPVKKCPTATAWEQGPGELMKDGKLRAYNLGKYFRNRYGNLLSSVYNESDIYVLSSNISRTLMTAYCVLAGLYEPTDKEVWLESLKWQPIPVRSIPNNADYMLLFNYAGCSNYLQELQLQLSMQEIVDETKINGFSTTLQELSKLSSDVKPPSNILIKDLENGHTYYDCFFIQERLGLPLPDWAGKFYPKRLEELAEYLFWVFSSNSQLRRLHCGFLLQSMIENFEKVRRGDPIKMYQYSAHDMTIASLLQCLNVYDRKLVPYLSTVMLELYKVGKKYEVVVVYRREIGMDGGKARYEEINLRIPGCWPRCWLDNFKELVRDLIPDSLEECSEGLSTIVANPS